MPGFPGRHPPAAATSARTTFISHHFRSEAGGRRSFHQDPQGRRFSEWNRRTELLLPNAGIMVRDRRSMMCWPLNAGKFSEKRASLEKYLTRAAQTRKFDVLSFPALR